MASTMIEKIYILLSLYLTECLYYIV